MTTRLPLRTVLGSTALLAVLTVSGCGGAGSDDDSGLASDKAAPAAEAPQETERDAGDTALSYGSDGLGTTADEASGAREEAPSAQEPAVISTGHISSYADDVALARAQVRRVVDSRGGKVTENETTSDGEGGLSSARLVVRVPAKDFAKATEELEKVGELISSSDGTEDVTTQVIDNEVRIRAQAKSLERVEVLLARAENLGEIVAIEAQLTRRQAELDSLKSQQAYLKDQTSLSTITVNLERTPDEDSDDEEAGGFMGGLRDGWDGLVTSFAVIATVIGFLLPFLVLVALVGVPLWLALRGVRRSRPVAQPADDTV